jgi:hypothetical protein
VGTEALAVLRLVPTTLLVVEVDQRAKATCGRCCAAACRATRGGDGSGGGRGCGSSGGAPRDDAGDERARHGGAELHFFLSLCGGKKSRKDWSRESKKCEELQSSLKSINEIAAGKTKPDARQHLSFTLLTLHHQRGSSQFNLDGSGFYVVRKRKKTAEKNRNLWREDDAT